MNDVHGCGVTGVSHALTSFCLFGILFSYLTIANWCAHALEAMRYLRANKEILALVTDTVQVWKLLHNRSQIYHYCDIIDHDSRIVKNIITIFQIVIVYIAYFFNIIQS